MPSTSFAICSEVRPSDMGMLWTFWLTFSNGAVSASLLSLVFLIRFRMPSTYARFFLRSTSVGHWNVGNLVEGCRRISLRPINTIAPGRSQDGIDVIGAIVRSLARLLRNHLVKLFEWRCFRSFLVLRVSDSVPDAFNILRPLLGGTTVSNKY
jgi:hypothetical protein